MIEGSGKLNEQSLSLNEKETLASGDVILTGEDSLAVIYWGDGSLTRLGSHTKIEIEENMISKDFSEIHISFDLLSGKTWSQVVSFIGKDSSFTQSFNGIEAGVRGTIYEVDVDADYLRVIDHAVKLSGEADIELASGEILNLKTFSLMQLSEFIKNFEDKSWTALNTALDSAHIIEMKENLDNSMRETFFIQWLRNMFFLPHKVNSDLKSTRDIDAIISEVAGYSVDAQQKIYNFIYQKYQDLNFVKPDDIKLYELKIRYKKLLISLDADGYNAQRLIETSVYDLEFISKQEIMDGLEGTLELFQNNADILEKNNISLPQLNFDYIPEGLRQEFSENFSSINTLFISGDNALLDTIQDSFNNVKDGVKGVFDNSIGNFISTN